MANDLKEKELNPSQDDYDAKFNDLTSPDHMAKEGKSGDLSGRERNPDGGLGSAAEDRERKGLYDPGQAIPKTPQQRISGMFSGKKKYGWIGGGVVGILLGVFSVIQGPFQFIHIAQLLSNIHISPLEDVTDSTLGRGYRYAKYPNNPELRRLGYVGNKVASGIETRAAAAGIEVSYNQAGILSDIKLNGKPLYEGNFGDLSNSQRRGVLKSAFRTLDYSGLATAVNSRVLAIKGGIDFHPLGNIKRGAQETFAEWRSRKKAAQADYIENGKTGTGFRGDTDTETKQEAESNSEFGEETEKIKSEVKNGYENGGIEGGKSALSKISTRGIAGVALICAVRAISEASDTYKQINVVLPLARQGMGVVSTGYQMMAAQEVSNDELRILNESFYDEITETSWAGASSIMAGQGEYGVGVEAPESIRMDGGNNFLSFLNNIPGLGVVCNIATSVVAQIGFFIVSPVAELIEEGIMQLIQNIWLDDIVRWLANKEVDPDAAGADWGSQVDYGVFHASNMVAISQGGRELSQAEVAHIRQNQLEDQKRVAESKQWTERYFSIKNPHSMISSISLKLPTSLAGYVSSIKNSLPETMNLFANISGVFEKAVFAQSTPSDVYDYGSPYFGFSLEELDRSDPVGNQGDDTIQNPYRNVEELLRVAGTDDINDLHDKWAEKCFDSTISEWISDDGVPQLRIVQQYQDEPYYEVDGDCADSNNDELFRYRLYVLSLISFESANCLEGDNESCQAIGIHTGI